MPRIAEAFYVGLGALVREARLKRKMSQEQLGDAVKLSRTSINNVEKGRQKLLLDAFCKVAIAVGEEPQSFLGRYLESTKSAPVEKQIMELDAQEQQFVRDAIAKSKRKK